MAGVPTDPTVAGSRLDSSAAEIRAYVRRYSDYAYPTVPIGLGVVILFAGANKLVAPAVWTEYAAPWVTYLWPESVLSLALAIGVTLLSAQRDTDE